MGVGGWVSFTIGWKVTRLIYSNAANIFNLEPFVLYVSWVSSARGALCRHLNPQGFCLCGSTHTGCWSAALCSAKAIRKCDMNQFVITTFIWAHWITVNKHSHQQKKKTKKKLFGSFNWPPLFIRTQMEPRYLREQIEGADTSKEHLKMFSEKKFTLSSGMTRSTLTSGKRGLNREKHREQLEHLHLSDDVIKCNTHVLTWKRKAAGTCWFNPLIACNFCSDFYAPDSSVLAHFHL